MSRPRTPAQRLRAILATRDRKAGAALLVFHDELAKSIGDPDQTTLSQAGLDAIDAFRARLQATRHAIARVRTARAERTQLLDAFDALDAAFADCQTALSSPVDESTVSTLRDTGHAVEESWQRIGALYQRLGA